MLNNKTGPKQILVYIAALVAPVLALLVQLELVRQYGEWPRPSVLFTLVVLLVSSWGGAWAGCVATTTSALLLIYWVIPPQGFKIGQPIHALGLAIFCSVGFGISIIAELYHRYRRRSLEYEKESIIRDATRSSEERFRALVTATSDVVYCMSPNWRDMCLIHGKAFVAQIETPSRTWLQTYIQADDQAHVLSVINESIRTKSMFELEHRVIRADGSLGWTFSRAVPLLDSNGEIREWFGAASDVTRRKRAEEAWRRLSAIVESTYDAIIGKTLDGTITSWNPAAERLYGYTAAEVLGRSISVLLPPDAPDDVSDILRRVANREHIENHETVRRRKDGSLVEVSLRISPILGESGNVVGASTIAHDITERKRMQEAILRNEKLAASGRLAAAIAHEVNNPLAGAMNAVHIASISPSQASEMLKLAEQELRRAAHMTELTLGFYGYSGGRQQVATIPKLVAEVMTLYVTKLRNRNVTVQHRYSCGSGTHGKGCPDGCKGCEGRLVVNASEMRYIISNLIANGIDALADNGIMQIRASRLSDKIQLTISDNGCGIRTENLKRIFEPFFTTKEAFGTGLGLWATQELVRKHNGTIKVRSSKNRGSVFRLTFPLEIPLGSIPDTDVPMSARRAA